MFGINVDALPTAIEGTSIEPRSRADLIDATANVSRRRAPHLAHIVYVERPLFKLTPKQIGAIRRSRLRTELERDSAIEAIACRPWSQLNQTERNDLYDACLDALLNEAPVKKTFMAEGSFGDFPICIMGVSGAYFVSAVDHDEAGPFGTLDEAVSWIFLNFGHMLVTARDEAE